MKGLSTEQIETLLTISNLADERGIFTLEQLKNKYFFLNYYAVLARLRRLVKRGLVKKIARGVYEITPEGAKVIEELKSHIK